MTLSRGITLNELKNIQLEGKNSNFFEFQKAFIDLGFLIDNPNDLRTIEIRDEARNKRGVIWHTPNGYHSKTMFNRIMVDSTPIKIIFVQKEPEIKRLVAILPQCKANNVSIYLGKDREWFWLTDKVDWDAPSKRKKRLTYDMRYSNNKNYKKIKDLWHKKCSKCQKWKSIHDFYKNTKVGRLDDRRSTCKQCS